MDEKQLEKNFREEITNMELKIIEIFNKLNNYNDLISNKEEIKSIRLSILVFNFRCFVLLNNEAYIHMAILNSLKLKLDQLNAHIAELEMQNLQNSILNNSKSCKCG